MTASRSTLINTMACNFVCHVKGHRYVQECTVPLSPKKGRPYHKCLTCFDIVWCDEMNDIIKYPAKLRRRTPKSITCYVCRNILFKGGMRV